MNKKLLNILSHSDYQIDKNGIMHFVKDQDRPAASVLLGKENIINDPNLYTKNAEDAEFFYSNNRYVKELVNFIAASKGIIVDLASGPGGGYIAPILKRLNPESLLITTDACLPVVKHQYDLFKPLYGDQFEMLDIDLSKELPFKDSSIDIFTGVGITNIEEGIENTLKEVARCLKINGELILSERFYAQNSATAKYLIENDNIFSIIDSLEAFCNDIGLHIDKIVELFKSKGKSDPQDGFPLDESDEWTVNHIYMRKI